MKAFIIGLSAVVIIGGGGYLVAQSSNKESSGKPATNTSEPADATPKPQDGTEQNTINTITYDGDKFSPASLTVKAGTTVTIKNTSSQTLQFDSDPHPDHTDNPELNVGIVSPDESKTFTVNKKGTFGFHDHLNASMRGEITVE